MDTTTGALADVGFTSDPNTTYTTTGFFFYGRQLLWDSNDTDAGIGRSFWAVRAEDDRFWRLLWNADNISDDEAVPLAVKTSPP